MGIANEHKNARPEKATATTKAALRPTMYASRTPGSTSGGNTLCSSEAPVSKTRLGFTPGAVLGRVASSLLTKADCPTEVLNAPPTVWKTVQHVG
jgi:hypothetical protein